MNSGTHLPTDHIADAAYYRMTAIVYWENAKMLEDAFTKKGEVVPGNRMAFPFYTLVSHAMELLLKCALLKRGTTPSELKKFELRHNLLELLKKIEAKGVPISEKTSSMVGIMSEQHAKHILRYTLFFENSGPAYVPEPSDIYEVLDELLMAGRIATHGV